MKRLLLTNWHAMRWIRLVIGLVLIQQAVQYQQLIFGFMAAFFLFQAIFNNGCGLNGCEVSTFKKK
jgi:hypothetical protein